MDLFSEIAASPELVTKITISAIQAMVTIVAVLGTAYLAYKYGIKKMRKEALHKLESEKYNRILDSLQECWKLLVYTTQTENEKCIITFEKDKDKSKTYFLNTKNAEEFLHALTAYFYSSGLGLFLPKVFKPLLFEYRSIIFGFLLATKNSEENKIEIMNLKMTKRLSEIHSQLHTNLREALELNNPQLELKK